MSPYFLGHAVTSAAVQRSVLVARQVTGMAHAWAAAIVGWRRAEIASGGTDGWCCSVINLRLALVGIARTAMFFDFLPRRQQALRPAAHVLFFLRARKAEKEMRLLAVAPFASLRVNLNRGIGGANRTTLFASAQRRSYRCGPSDREAATIFGPPARPVNPPSESPKSGAIPPPNAAALRPGAKALVRWFTAPAAAHPWPGQAPRKTGASAGPNGGWGMQPQSPRPTAARASSLTQAGRSGGRRATQCAAPLAHRHAAGLAGAMPTATGARKCRWMSALRAPAGRSGLNGARRACCVLCAANAPARGRRRLAHNEMHKTHALAPSASGHLAWRSARRRVACRAPIAASSASDHRAPGHGHAIV